jgi:glycine/D-amino acid oxidase-like deaminating enzyme
VQEVDYLIVGQGIAGTLLAYFLLEQHQKILIIDDNKPFPATQVAAGIINPITGRRYVKSWRVEELIPFATTTYRQIEQKLGIDIYHPYPVLRALFSPKEENDWLKRSIESGYEKYILEEAVLEHYANYTKPAFTYGELRHTAQVQIGKMATAFRAIWTKQNLILTEAFNYQEVKIETTGVNYKNINAKKIIFCEGYAGKFNPFFSYLPFRGVKGEALLVRITDADFSKILKHRVFIVPMGKNTYWIGSTDDQNFEDELPTLNNRQKLETNLQEILTIPFEVLSHQAAVRPTVKDRRPFLGLHPNYAQLGIFNGLGTKGASLGPFFANQMANFLLRGEEIDDAVNIHRFQVAL